MRLAFGRPLATASLVAERSFSFNRKTPLAGSCIPKNEDPNRNLRPQTRAQVRIGRQGVWPNRGGTKRGKQYDV